MPRHSWICDRCGTEHASKQAADECEREDKRRAEAEAAGDWLRRQLSDIVTDVWFIEDRPTAEAFIAAVREVITRFKGQQPK